MGSIFGKAKPEANRKQDKMKVTDKDRAILNLKITRDKLTKYQKRMDVDAENLKRQAQQLLSNGRKDRALLTMKLRKHKLNEVDSIDSKLLTVMKMIEDIEWESTQVEALRALEAGTAALNKLHEEMSVDDVERLLEESNEAIEIENEISALLAGQFSVQDESELEEELEALYAQEMGTSMTPTIAGDSKEGLSLPTVPNTPVLPTVPSHSVDAALEEPTSAVLA